MPVINQQFACDVEGCGKVSPPGAALDKDPWQIINGWNGRQYACSDEHAGIGALVECVLLDARFTGKTTACEMNGVGMVRFPEAVQTGTLGDYDVVIIDPVEK